MVILVCVILLEHSILQLIVLCLSDVHNVKNVADPLDKVKAGLRSNNDAAVPLKSVHITAKLVDLAAQVRPSTSYQTLK